MCPQPDPRPGEPSAEEAERRRLCTDARALGHRLERHPNDGWRLADPWPMRRGTLAAFRGLVGALLPPPPAPQVPLERIQDSVRRLLRYMAPLAAWGFVLLVHLLDWSPLWRLESWRRLRSLPRARAARVLEGIAKSRFSLLRSLMLAARAAVLSMYYDQDEVHGRIGYAPEQFIGARRALRERLVGGAHERPADRIGPYSEGLE